MIDRIGLDSTLNPTQTSTCSEPSRTSCLYESAKLLVVKATGLDKPPYLYGPIHIKAHSTNFSLAQSSNIDRLQSPAHQDRQNQRRHSSSSPSPDPRSGTSAVSTPEQRSGDEHSSANPGPGHHNVLSICPSSRPPVYGGFCFALGATHRGVIPANKFLALDVGGRGWYARSTRDLARLFKFLS
ncbi:uncharacterized protein BJX67DRAFT_233499 [Aspergillus lucknowensis]|uniref:Uncharacterized protein n=1 Tax=Aspergillus lucknowensis TaxID=176173 RepID=A0ABR4LHA0_9EURO